MKFKMLKKIESHAYRLNVLTDIHDVFHVQLLRLATNNLLSSQRIVIVDSSVIINEEGDEEYEIEEIVDEKSTENGLQYKIKWIEYQQIT